MKLKHCENIFYVIANSNLIVKHVIQIKNEIMINVNVSVEGIVCTKELIDRILAHLFLSIVST